MASLFSRASYSASSKSSTGLCENCGIRPKFQNHDYCGRTCSTAAETRRNSAAPAANAQGPTFSYSFSSRPNARTTSNMCENCLSRAKSQESDEDGTVITHPYCGIRCYQASQQTSWPASTIPAPAAAFVSQEPLTFRKERTNTALGRKISLMMQERWKSDESQVPKLKTIYRINLPGQVYRRFDLALQMNDGCPVRTTYYGGVAACSLADDANPTPCASESCGLCDALRSSFGNVLHGESSSDGDYGPGLYTYANPALAYHATVSGDDLQPQGSNFALIQCRVVARADSVPSSNSYAGFIDDSGVAFCAQPTAIIPTHVLICNTTAPPKASQHAASVNSNSVSLGSAPSSTASPIASSIGQQVGLSDTGETKSNPVNGNKGKGKAQVKALPQKPQGKGPALASSSKQQPGADLTESAVVNQGALNPPQSGGGNTPLVVLAPKAMPGAFKDAGNSAPPPPSYGESGAAGGHDPQAIYQSNLASPAPGCVYVHTSAGFIPIPNPPPPGLSIFVLGPDGKFYSAGVTSTVAYPPIPPSTLSPGSAANQGLLQSPSPDPAAAALRAQINPDPRASPPGPRSPLARIDDDNAMDYINSKESKTPLPRSGRPASVSYESNRGGHQKATRQSSYPMAGHADDDDDLRSTTAAAYKYVKRSRDLESRMDEDDDDFDPLKPDENLARR